MTMPRTQSISEILGRDPVHPFPARMAASIALKAISHACTPLKILDPMMGSGTVLALARSKGHYARGFDVDPLATLIGRVWTTPLDKDAVRNRASKILREAKLNFKSLKIRDAYPDNSDKETKKFIRYWFDETSRRQLKSLATEIGRCRDKAIRNALWCAFSRLIITKQSGASLALDLSHSRPHKVFKTAPKKPFEGFTSAVEHVLANSISTKQSGRGPAPQIQVGDARRLKVRSSSIDLVLTSPPYLNAIDYMRCSKFSLVWMGESTERIRKIRGESIGSEIGQYCSENDDVASEVIGILGLEKRLSARHTALLRRFTEDMAKVMEETNRVLVPGGQAIFVVGENTLKGVYVKNAKLITELAIKAGLKFKARSIRKLPPNKRYLPPPSRASKHGQMNIRMRKEVVLTFEKSKKAA